MTRVVLLIKDFELAKRRLSSVLDHAARKLMAVDFAVAALGAVGPGALVVAGSESAARLARESGNEVVLEDRPDGQNRAAALGIAEAVARGADAVLVLSSDLPLIRPEIVAGLLQRADALPRPVVVAAPAVGRGGTNALYLAPPNAVGLHFGDDSLALYEADAVSRGVRFVLHEVPELALDVDEPADLDALRERRQAG